MLSNKSGLIELFPGVPGLDLPLDEALPRVHVQCLPLLDLYRIVCFLLLIKARHHRCLCKAHRHAWVSYAVSFERLNRHRMILISPALLKLNRCSMGNRVAMFAADIMFTFCINAAIRRTTRVVKRSRRG